MWACLFRNLINNQTVILKNAFEFFFMLKVGANLKNKILFIKIHCPSAPNFFCWSTKKQKKLSISIQEGCEIKKRERGIHTHTHHLHAPNPI